MATHTIQDRIERECLTFRLDSCYDRRAKNIYLGREEHEEMKLYAASVCHYMNVCHGRNQYRGMDIFQVDADSHLAVS